DVHAGGPDAAVAANRPPGRRGHLPSAPGTHLRLPGGWIHPRVTGLPFGVQDAHQDVVVPGARAEDRRTLAALLDEAGLAVRGKSADVVADHAQLDAVQPQFLEAVPH